MRPKSKSLSEQLGELRSSLPKPLPKPVPKVAAAPKPASTEPNQSMGALVEGVVPLRQKSPFPPISVRNPARPRFVPKQPGTPNASPATAQRPPRESSLAPEKIKFTRTSATPPARSKAPSVPVPTVRIGVGPNADVLWRGARRGEANLLDMPVSGGRREQLVYQPGAELREVVIGLDFGTSCTKVVVSDRTVGQSFAVPFLNAVGIQGYLLPSRLYESILGYALEAQTGTCQVHGDLKLALLNKRDDALAQVRIAAFLALVIRRARAWLFDAHAALYKDREILWTLTLGHPASHSTDGEMKHIYQALGFAAWELAGTEDSLTPARCASSVKRYMGASVDSIDVLPIPEIAAQVFGFVTSTQFDAKRRNIFMLTDVGAGTVDSCLFRAFKDDQGLWCLEVYTSSVKSNGVMNLHRHRVGWWTRNLEVAGAPNPLLEQLRGMSGATEVQTAIPTTFEGYVSGVTVDFQGGAKSPDNAFYEERLLPQVQGETLYHAYGARLLDQRQLTNVPFFLCGGGARLNFYQQLAPSLLKVRGLTWLSARPMEFMLPKELVAPGLAREDFDRLSVAYGLSRINYGNAERATPMPALSSTGDFSGPSYTDRYISKDMV